MFRDEGSRMSAAIDIRVRFPVDDDALSDLHARAFGTASTSTHSWAMQLNRHSLTWVGAFDDDALTGFVQVCWDGGAHAFVLDTATNTTTLVRRVDHRPTTAGLIRLNQ